MHMLLFSFVLIYFYFIFNHKVLYNQWMKLVSGERPAVSGMKHGSILIMHSSSLEHFRTGSEGNSTWLQIKSR